MTSSPNRIAIALSVALTLVGMTLIAGSGPATAAQPRTGHYVYDYTYGPPPPNSYHGGITFDVSGEPRKVRDFAWSGFTCGTVTISKALKVNRKGKFRYTGNATTAGGSKVPVVVKGKFIRKNKARVTVRDGDGPTAAACGTLQRVIVKRQK